MANVNRIFVGNLPLEILGEDVENEFSAYGTVKKVELKHKKDPLTDAVLSTFAFVTISITEDLLNQCLQEFKNETFRGRYLIVSVARESFMEKLKREREESTQVLPSMSLNHDVTIRPEGLKIKDNVKLIPIPHSDDSSSSSSIVEPEVIVKRKSKLFMENGKIKIPSIDANNLVQDPIQVERKHLDEKSLKADQKRVESLIKMKATYTQQKKAVQQALSNIESTQNKKIVFDEPSPEFGNTKTKSKVLFEENDGDNDDWNYKNSFEIKKQFQGEKGARLQKLQSRFQNDQRFNMNETFMDDNGDVEEDETEKFVDLESKSDERKWQYDMLESVIGRKLQPETKKKSDNPMLRYDPTKNDHLKYEKVLKRKAQNNDLNLESTKQMKLNNENDFQVSKEQFFNVTNHLSSSLKSSSEGFSLLSMFGRGTEVVEKESKNPYKEIVLTKGQQELTKNNNSMFDDDSSDEDIFQERLTVSQEFPVKNLKQTNSKKAAKADIWHEPFFIFGNDQRLQDGLTFFLQSSSTEVVEEEFENKRKEMRNIIKRKIKKSIERVVPRGRKPNKRFGRLVKNV